MNEYMAMGRKAPFRVEVSRGIIELYQGDTLKECVDPEYFSGVCALDGYMTDRLGLSQCFVCLYIGEPPDKIWRWPWETCVFRKGRYFAFPCRKKDIPTLSRLISREIPKM